MDNLEFLDGSAEPIAEVQPVAEPVAEPQATEPVAEAPKGPARGPDGKFAAKEPEPALEPAEPAKPAIPEGYVPVKALQELREELKALKQAPPVQPQVQQPERAPDVFEDPEGYDAHQQRKLLNLSLNFSERFAVKEHGKEAVEQAKQWATQKAESNPFYAQEFLSDPDPYEKIVADWKRETTFSKIDLSEIDQFLAWKEAQLATQPAATPPPQPTPTGSIASAPSAGGAQHIAVGPGVAFDDVIK